MMRKLYLPAVPVSEGARLTAQAVMRSCVGRVDVAAAKWCISTRDLERTIEGSLVSGTWIMRAIGLGTGGAVQRDDWASEPRGGWFDLVAERRAA